MALYLLWTSPALVLIYNTYFLIVCYRKVEYFIGERKKKHDISLGYLVWIRVQYLINFFGTFTPILSVIVTPMVTGTPLTPNSLRHSFFNLEDTLNCISMIMLLYFVALHQRKLQLSEEYCHQPMALTLLGEGRGNSNDNRQAVLSYTTYQ